MWHDRLTRDLYLEISKVPLIDPHSHINPLAPVSKNLDDILGYHYYTELAHSAGMSKEPLASDVEPRERVRAILKHMNRFDNTVQYSWFVEIAKAFLGFHKDQVGEEDCDWLWEAAAKKFGEADWEQQVFAKTKLEKIFLTNEFDDPLESFDTKKYVPCLRTDSLVYGLHRPEIRDRLSKVSNIEVNDWASIKRAVSALFLRFKKHGAKACAISLPPNFTPKSSTFDNLDQIDANDTSSLQNASQAIFWLLAEQCREFGFPFDLMIGVNRSIYKQGVYQGQDLFDQRTSLIQYEELFNAFPKVTFCLSVLTSSQNQELASYSWIFPNVVTSGHWWYANIPGYIQHDCRTRLQAVPKTKQLGYYSDAYKLEFVLPKYNMYRRVLAQILADDFVRTGLLSETRAVDLARHILRDNIQRIFKV